ncbi:DNA/RNA non-specific endonuclease [Clostridium tertium]|uniref:DNA/RNA non-specific endonuclease n=1 Tax=Clostridium tertium TaxID=1559 RepID=UPI001FAC271D|nr:DNA/RNA non-specific endonuclease [Clostridium tertium]MDB1969408.1 DNA/RNA non-specific endonuclease [Clostridium tertium]
MKKFISIFHIIMGSIAVYISILFLAVAMDLPFLAVVGLAIAPACIIYFNKKFTIKAPKYYLTLFGIMLIAIVVSAIIMPTDVNTINQQEIASKNKDEVAKTEEDSKTAEEKEDSKAEDNSKDDETKENSTDTKEDIFEGYRLIEVDGGNLSGYREPNVVVDIGFGDREYYAFTNEYGQLVKVIAKEIILQDDSTEPVNSNGRYYPDEAKVPGVESKNLDEGHVIADSLGGVSNAYNITPQNSILNRHGDQAYMEKVIRDAGGCTDFVAIITYPDTTTQIPNHYSYTYTINGNVINDEFDNINPDEYNASLESNTSTNNSTSSSNGTANNSSTSNNTATNESSNTQSNISSSGIVYWTPKGGSYHTRKSCPTLSRSKTILEGTIQESGKSDPCDKCH